ncbi:MAG: N-acetyltransferase family protein [Pseudomonadota bacterium]
MSIRPATPTDATAIAAIWNPIIRDTAITFTDAEKTEADLRAMIAGQPTWVHDTGTVTGFATFGTFRGGPGYRHTGELSLFLAPDTRGQGHGAALLAALETPARARGIHVLVAGIAGSNFGAIRFFARHGYTETGRMPELGRKFGAWHDLVLMQKTL